MCILIKFFLHFHLQEKWFSLQELDGGKSNKKSVGHYFHCVRAFEFGLGYFFYTFCMLFMWISHKSKAVWSNEKTIWVRIFIVVYVQILWSAHSAFMTDYGAFHSILESFDTEWSSNHKMLFFYQIKSCFFIKFYRRKNKVMWS